MSKVSAVENIIRELHGPVDAMLSLCGTAEREEGATASVVYANAACTQTEPVLEESSRQADEVQTTLGKRRKRRWKRYKDVFPKHKRFHCLLPVIRRTVIPHHLLNDAQEGHSKVSF